MCIRDRAGRLTVIQNGESWYIDGAPKRTPEFSDGSVVQDFQFVLHCPYPYWRSTADGSAQVAGLTKLFQFPCSLAEMCIRDSHYTEDIDKQISAEIGKGFVARADFNSKNDELKTCLLYTSRCV